jgi:hypothetical protein
LAATSANKRTGWIGRGTVSGSSIKARKAEQRVVGDRMLHGSQRRKQPGEASCAVPYLSSVLGLTMVELHLREANGKLNARRGCS